MAISCCQALSTENQLKKASKAWSGRQRAFCWSALLLDHEFSCFLHVAFTTSPRVRMCCVLCCPTEFQSGQGRRQAFLFVLPSIQVGLFAGLEGLHLTPVQQQLNRPSAVQQNSVLKVDTEMRVAQNWGLVQCLARGKFREQT